LTHRGAGLSAQQLLSLQLPVAIGELHQVLRELLATARPPHGVEFQVDVDPFNMM